MKNDWSSVKKRLLKSPSRKRAYEHLDIGYELRKRWDNFKIWLSEHRGRR